MVGRVRELTRLEDVLDACRQGRRATVFVGGEAGIGKTRLVTELARRARAGGVEVLVGGCLDLEVGGVPYAPVVEALTDLGHRLAADGSSPPGAAPADIFGPDAARLGLVSGDDSGARGALEGQTTTLQAVERVLERLAQVRPVLLIVEDVHWGDRSTRDLIAYLASSAPPPPLAMVVTYRSDDVTTGHPLRGFMAELERRPGVSNLRLGRFGRADAAALLAAVLGTTPDPALTEAIYQRSEGNPFFLEELARAASLRADRPSADAVPPLLSDLLASRLARLSPDTQLVLRVAAVGGRRIEHDRLSAVVPLEESPLDIALREARDANIITAEPATDRYEFRHALLHEAVYADVLPGERRIYHARYAELLAATPARSGIEAWAELAHHWRAAGHDGRALAAMVEAGLAAEAGYALPEAHRYYEAAVELWESAQRATDDERPPVPLGRSELLARAADAASRAGALERAIELTITSIGEVDPVADPTAAGLLHERRAWFLWRAGRHEEGLDEYREAVDLVPREPASAARARVLAAYADALERIGEPAEARPHAQAAIAIAAATGSPLDEGHARHVLGLVLCAEGDTDSGLAELQRARELAERNGDVADVAGTYLHLWRVLSEHGRADEMVTRAGDAGDFCRAAGLDVAAQLLDCMAAGFLHQLGRWPEAESRLQVDNRDLWGLPAVVHHVVTGLLDVDLGRLDRSREHLETARCLGVQVHDGRINGLLYRGLAELALWEGRREDALATVMAGMALTGDDEMLARLCAVGLRAVADLADAERVTSGRATPSPDAGRLEDCLDVLDRRARARGAPATSEVRAAVAMGLAEVARRGREPDPEAWAEAARRWEGLRFPAPAVYCRWRQAEAMLVAGRRAEAAELWQAAYRAATTLGAASLQRAIKEAAGRAALLISMGGEPRPPEEIPFGLTPRELEVLSLVAAGHTNREIGAALFMSAKTASVHVSRILTKLGVRTRAQAAAVAARAGLGSSTGGPA